MQLIRPKRKSWFCSKSKEPGGCEQNINKTGEIKSCNGQGKMKYLFYSNLGYKCQFCSYHLCDICYDLYSDSDL